MRVFFFLTSFLQCKINAKISKIIVPLFFFKTINPSVYVLNCNRLAHSNFMKRFSFVFGCNANSFECFGFAVAAACKH